MPSSWREPSVRKQSVGFENSTAPAFVVPQKLDAARFGQQAAAAQQFFRWQPAGADAQSQTQPLLRPVLPARHCMLGGAEILRRPKTAAPVSLLRGAASGGAGHVDASRLAAFIAAQVHAGNVLAAASQPDGVAQVQVKLVYLFICRSYAAMIDLRPVQLHMQ